MAVSPRREKQQLSDNSASVGFRKGENLNQNIEKTEASSGPFFDDDDAEKTPKNWSASVVDVTPPVKDPG